MAHSAERPLPGRSAVVGKAECTPPPSFPITAAEMPVSLYDSLAEFVGRLPVKNLKKSNFESIS